MEVVLKDPESGVPFIHNREELKLWIRPMYIISDMLKDYDTYDKEMLEIVNAVRGSFTIRQCREYPIKFRFNKHDKTVYSLELRHFMINMILWGPFVEVGDLDILNDSFIIDPETEIPNINDYINYKIIKTLNNYHVESTKINYALSKCIDNLRNISIDFSLILGLNFSIDTIVDMYESNQEIRDMMEVTFPEDMQPHEIETILDKYEEREVEIYTSIKDNPIGIMLRSHTGVKKKQFREFTISEGLKPSLEGITIPKPIENSTVLKGLASASDLYLDASGARKSLNIIGLSKLP
jgi:hypothetical protein